MTNRSPNFTHSEFKRGREHGVGSYEAVKRFCMQHESYRRLYNGRSPAMINVRPFHTFYLNDIFKGME